jgi:UDP-glucose 4-epimerase
MTAPSARTLVVGSGGLLGQHVLRQLPGAVGATDVPWLSRSEAKTALRQRLRPLVESGGDWNLAWCAGPGVVATPPADIARELDLFTTVLDELAELVGRDSRGAVFFASSAGGVYAGSPSPPFTETSPVGPLAPYGVAKLAMEDELRSFASATGTAVLVGRIANLYGPGQNLAKPQGLVSQICRTYLSGQPLALYVPMDTRRDYLYVEDCARMVVAGLDGLRQRITPPDLVLTKILASGRSTTVGGLLGESTRLFRRRPRVVLGASDASRSQVRDLRLRSAVWPELDRLARTPLLVGIARTADDVARRLRAAA